MREEPARQAAMEEAGEGVFALGDGLFLIDLPQPMPGFVRFISAWFFRDSLGRRVLVDPGPADTVPLLNRRLETLTDRLDLVLLTHIHLDHSGGAGLLTERWGQVPFLAHRRAFTHLRNPGKLWAASVRALGDVALTYGEPAPLAAPLWEADEAGRIEVFETPGHAPHHLAFRVLCGARPLLFAGEAAGMTLPTDRGLWLRPTTPPRFDAEAALASLSLLEREVRGDERLCYAHWGACDAPLERLSLAKQQMEDWLTRIGSMRDQPPQAIAEHLLRTDPLLAGPLPDGLMDREKIFMTNSVKGFLGFLAA